MARMDANIAVSAELAGFIENAAGLPTDRIRVIDQGISDPGAARRCSPTARPTDLRHHRAHDKAKGIDVLLLALANIPCVRGLFVGDGEDEDKLKGLGDELGVANRVSWTGWREDARAFVADFDIFVLVSKGEGFGRVLVEAAFAECPVIRPRWSGRPKL